MGGTDAIRAKAQTGDLFEIPGLRFLRDESAFSFFTSSRGSPAYSAIFSTRREPVASYIETILLAEWLLFTARKPLIVTIRGDILNFAAQKSPLTPESCSYGTHSRARSWGVKRNPEWHFISVLPASGLHLSQKNNIVNTTVLQ